MLQPQSYPSLVGRSLLLETEPFAVMVDDDNPWIEGMFFTICIGILAGIAQFIGSLLMTASLPPADAMIETVVQGWRQLSISGGGEPLLLDSTIRQIGQSVAHWQGLTGGWLRLFTLILVPFGLLFQWLFYAVLVYAIAQVLGGKGSFNQTLGTVALMAAPSTLLFLTAIPFVSVSGLLLALWALLIVYRAVEITHELPWTQAALVAVIPWLLLTILTLITTGVMGFIFGIGGIL